MALREIPRAAAGNGRWIAFVSGFAALHRSGMGSGMGQGGHSGHDRTRRRHDTTTSDSPVEEAARPPRR